ncbi:hypothetical protein LIPSTDRAFT_76499 [Lipomyces starkeyi NRRL Y-11557]|uniref:Uncharacterized protein n=1 Tax=Lipomyces starkeyi NRRL Y-11557 TaxID=675824 RepID=A0A1E3PUB0_LIPST|nr:hypothetical protein LIPSTDRAFT_76499 [Lipomyces starkeyi NRRL Y-11557]
MPRLSRIYSYFEWITDTSMDALQGVSDDIQLSVRSILTTRWEKIRTVPMLLAAVLDTSLSDQKRVSPSPDQLEEIGAWLDSNYSSTESDNICSELLCFLQKTGSSRDLGTGRLQRN